MDSTNTITVAALTGGSRDPTFRVRQYIPRLARQGILVEEHIPFFGKSCGLPSPFKICSRIPALFSSRRADLVWVKKELVACIKYLWPLLQDGCSLYIHEAHHLKLASLFFDKEWWRSNCNCDAPGLIGAGSGLGLIPSSGGFKSSLGYTVKNPKV